MIPFPLPALTGAPWRLIGAGVITLSLLGAFGYHKWIVTGLERDAAIAQKGEAKALTRVAEIGAQKAAIQTSLVHLRNIVNVQNRAIADLETKASDMESAANRRAAETLKRGQRERVALRMDTHFGPEAMQLWFESQFSP